MRKNLLAKLALLFLVSFSILKANNTVNIGITDETFETELGIYINDYYVLDSGSDYFLDLSFYTSDEEGEDPIFTYGFRVASPFSSDMGLSVAFGMRAITTKHNSDVFTAVPFALFGRYELNDQINVTARVMYSPSILNFVDAEGYKEFRAQGNYALVDNNVYVFGGYRYIQTKYEDYKFKPGKGIYIGAQIRY